MLGTHVWYVDGNDGKHLAVVVNQHDNDSNGNVIVDVFVYGYGAVIENVNNVASRFSFKELDTKQTAVQEPA